MDEPDACCGGGRRCSLQVFSLNRIVRASSSFLCLPKSNNKRPQILSLLAHQMLSLLAHQILSLLPMSVKKERETTRHEEKLLQCDSCFARFNASMTAIDPRSDPFKSSPLKLRSTPCLLAQDAIGCDVD
ncbi:hypothetical protein Prudu_898S000200 [Prunus dulcis]|uniref:Uncharacterized protein n=1 Tax=Prunus dulcis TaxID=3755 RepID=A0A5H2YA94_PRUDU|nr:hypothetical protein Prudu_898S000200 [Prunus dulcis]